ncbi:myo-inositol 2-dehydrogenase-like [Pelecanus crispus]|uniref:myo-inositol 2-dehydrogenase-like n=1 Tax=Pelecanus crispus TaxID=36300 RepID=UPI003F5D46F5
MKFPSGAIVTLDISQHCTKSCDQRLEVHGSQGTLRVDNQNPLGITEHGTSVSIYSQTQADRYRDAHRELFRHFLRTLKGKEPPVITKEQFLWTIQVAAAAEQSWRNGSAVDLRNEAIDSSVVKTEIM